MESKVFPLRVAYIKEVQNVPRKLQFLNYLPCLIIMVYTCALRKLKVMHVRRKQHPEFSTVVTEAYTALPEGLQDSDEY